MRALQRHQNDIIQVGIMHDGHVVGPLHCPDDMLLHLVIAVGYSDFALAFNFAPLDGRSRSN